MGYNARNDEIRDNVQRMQRAWEAERNALATIRRFNATLSAKGYVWFWPKIAAAITAKHPWLVIACDSCGTVVDLDLRVKPRDPEASIALRSATYDAHAAMDMVAHALSRCRNALRSESLYPIVAKPNKMSAIGGAKRTLLFALHGSASDPKRTLRSWVIKRSDA
jgi:hypothetical protein